MKLIFRQIILSSEFIEEASKTVPGQNPIDLRREMVASLRRQVEATGAILDAEDLNLEACFIDGKLDHEERRKRARSQLIGRSKPTR